MSTLYQPELTDICASRHRGNEQSEAAFRKLADSLPSARGYVLLAIQRSGKTGMSAKELASQWDVGLNTISGRFSELKKAGMIRKVGVRDASGVYVANQ